MKNLTQIGQMFCELYNVVACGLANIKLDRGRASSRNEVSRHRKAPAATVEFQG